MDNDETTTETIVPEPTKPATQTLSDFISSIGSTISDLRARYRLSENGALNTVRYAMDYDLQRRTLIKQQEAPVGEASDQ